MTTQSHHSSTMKNERFSSFANEADEQQDKNRSIYDDARGSLRRAMAMMMMMMMMMMMIQRRR